MFARCQSEVVDLHCISVRNKPFRFFESLWCCPVRFGSDAILKEIKEVDAAVRHALQYGALNDQHHL